MDENELLNNDSSNEEIINLEVNEEVDVSKYKKMLFTKILVKALITFGSILFICLFLIFDDVNSSVTGPIESLIYYFKTGFYLELTGALGIYEYLIIITLAIVIWVIFVILLYKNTISPKDIVFLAVGDTKKRTEYVSMYGEEKKHIYEKKTKKVVLTYSIIDYYMIIIIAVLTVLFMFTFIMFPAVVSQSSMEDTLYEGNRVLVFNTNKLEKGDIIVFSYDYDYQQKYGCDENELLIKRVIATSGDEFSCINGVIYINGLAMNEDYVSSSNKESDTYTLNDVIKHNSNASTIKALMDGENKIPEGYILVLGDNRRVSNDSEEFGLVCVKQVVGKVKYYKSSDGWKNIEK